MRVLCDHAEYAKFCYLIKVMDAVDRAHAIAKERAKALLEQEGYSAEMRYDWSKVVQHVTPQLGVVFLRDSHRYEDDRKFVEHPIAVIVARTAQVVDLDGEFELTLEEQDQNQLAQTDVTNAFAVLSRVVSSQEGKRTVDAERILRQLERVLRVK